jgi:hypothetical protein
MKELCPACGKELPRVVGIQIADIQVLAVKPGDRLVAKVNRDWITPEEGEIVKARIRTGLQLDESVPVVVVTREWEFSVERGAWE